MARSRARPADRRITPLDWAERTGRTVWWAGLLLQMLWHVKMASTALALDDGSDSGMVDPDDSSFSSSLPEYSALLAGCLPASSLLINGSIAAAILSAWWNPRFVQVSRGFSRHLLGFRQWYSFQGLIVFFRIIFRRLAEVDGPSPRGVDVQIMPHVIMAGLMILVCPPRSHWSHCLCSIPTNVACRSSRLHVDPSK